MALKEFWNGSVGPLLYDDEDTYEDGETLRGVRVDQILLDSAPSTAGEGIRQTATVTEDELEDAIAKKHTQNTDTALGAQSEDLDMNTHQVVALSVPDAAGEAIRQTEKITEVALEDAVDKKHTQGTDTSIGTISIYANNAAAVSGGLSTGDLYRTGSDPDVVCVVH